MTKRDLIITGAKIATKNFFQNINLVQKTARYAISFTL